MPSRPDTHLTPRARSRPAALRRWLPWLAIFFLALLPFFVPIPVSLRRHIVIGQVGYLLHVPLLAVITLLLYARGPAAGRIWLTAAVAVLIGGAIEFLQILVGRSALLIDFLLDLIGIGIALSWIIWRRSGQRLFLVTGVLLIGLALAEVREVPLLTAASLEARARFPLLDDFSSPRSAYLWDEVDNGAMCRVARAETDSPALRLFGGPPGAWPGARMEGFPEDWSGLQELSFCARSVAPTAGDLRFAVSIGDFPGRGEHEWYSGRFTATPDWQTFCIDLAAARSRQSGRPLYLEEMAGIVFFFPSPQDSVALEIDDIQLR